MKNISKWFNVEFISSSSETLQFKEFYKDFCKWIRKEMIGNEIKISKGHFYVSGFIKLVNERIIYFSISDIRGNKWHTTVLIRIATSFDDYTGGSNNFTDIANFKKNVLRLGGVSE